MLELFGLFTFAYQSSPERLRYKQRMHRTRIVAEHRRRLEQLCGREPITAHEYQVTDSPKVPPSREVTRPNMSSYMQDSGAVDCESDVRIGKYEMPDLLWAMVNDMCRNLEFVVNEFCTVFYEKFLTKSIHQRFAIECVIF